MENVNEERDEQLVELAKVQGDFEAQVIKSVLESEGIEAAIKAGMVQDIFPFTVDGLGAAKVYVKKKDLARAEAVIEEYRGKE